MFFVQMRINHMNILAKRKKTELASKRMIDITTAIGIPMELILSYDIRQENDLFDQNGLIKGAQKIVLIQQLEICLTDNKELIYQYQNLELLLILWLSSKRSSFRD